MKKIISFLASFQLFLLTGHAQDAGDGSLLWRVVKQGSRTSWLFGTIHMICPEDYIWTPEMAQALNSSDIACLELDMDDPALQMQVAAGLIDNGGRTLRDYFTPAQYARLDAYVQDSLGGNLAMFQHMKLFALQLLFIKKMGACDSAIAYETVIMNTAHRQQKAIEGLETAEQQLAMMSSIPADTIVRMIMSMVDTPETNTGFYKDMVAAYKAQDLERLYRFVLEAEGIGNMKGVMLDDRNRRWISRMDTLMKDRSVFFAVGAGHLPGDQGVVSLLRRAGYRVTPVR